VAEESAQDVSLLAAINAAEGFSYSSDENGDLGNERASNIERYLGKNTIQAPEGRSQVVDRSVYEEVQRMMPSLTRIFANGDDVVELPPVGPEDEEPSKQEAQYLNHVILQKNNWFEIFDTAAKDALITKAGYLYPYVENRRQPWVDKYTRQTPESLAYLMQDKPEVVSHKEYPDPDYVEPPPQPMMQMGPDGQPLMGPQGPMPVIDPATGQPVMQSPPPPPMLYDVELRRTKIETQYCIDVLPPERCKIAETTKTVQLRECPYFEYYDFPTVSELREMGYEVSDDDVTSYDNPDTQEETARNQFAEHYGDENTPDPAMKRVKCRWVWIKYDYDEDGIAEMQYVVVMGAKILHREEVTRIPVAVLCPDLLPHRHVGLCPADTVGEIQDTKTAILRGGLDNLYISNNPQKFADGKFVNLDDLGVSRPGGTIRLKNGAVFGQNFGVMPIPFVFPQAMEGLEYMDHVKTGRTGVDNNFQGLEAGQLTQLQPGTVNQISGMAAQRTEQVARHLANGVTEMALILHELILKNGHKADVVKLRGKWVEVDPSTWKRRTDFRISVGFSAGNQDAPLTRLLMIGNMQKEAMMGGLPVVTPENIYETMNEIIKVSDLQAPQRFITHPSKAPQKPPPQPDVTVVAMEQIKSQSSEKIKGAELQSEEKIKSAELNFDKYKTDQDNQTKLTIAQMQAQHAHELERVRGEHAGQLEGLKAHLNPKTKEAEAKQSDVKQKDTLIQQLMDNQRAVLELLSGLGDGINKLSGPKQIVRGKDGKASHVVPV
jgi:hypothetical protein